MNPSARVLQVNGDADANVVSCIRCKLTFRFTDDHARVVSDLLASHWADDHYLPAWRDAAADARERLWRHHPDLLEKLNSVSDSKGSHDRAG